MNELQEDFFISITSTTLKNITSNLVSTKSIATELDAKISPKKKLDAKKKKDWVVACYKVKPISNMD